MKLCVALRHVHFEDLGLFAEPLRRHGYAVRYIDTPVEELRPADAVDAGLLVVLGGPMSANQWNEVPWLEAELRAVTNRLVAKRPTLGVCLGAQLIAIALGGDVVRASAAEICWAPLVLSTDGNASPLSAIKGLQVLHWHGDRFELPAGAISLASTPLCPHQAFAVGRHTLALQFHAEVIPELFESWLVGNAVELNTVGVDPEGLRQGMRQHGVAMARAAPSMIDAWLESLDC